MIVVYSGYNQRAVIAFLRTLEKNRIDYYIVASCDKDTIFLTEYREKVVFTRKIRDIELNEMISSIDMIKTKMDNPNDDIFIAPTSEYLNRFLLDYRRAFEDKGCIIPLVNKELYEKISDKKTFVDLCEKHGILVPHTVSYDDGYDGVIVAKPNKYLSSDGIVYSPVFINDRCEYEEFLKTHSYEDFSFQEYLVGESYYLLFYFSLAGDVYSFSQINYKQQADGKSILYAKTADIHKESRITEPYVNMLFSLGFHGLIMIELRKTADDYYMIEANPRFWGPSQLFCDANYNLFECMLYDYGMLKQKNDTDNTNEAYYLWSGGFENDIDDIVGNDVYFRPDTEKIYYKERLERLYKKSSKHSGYQVMPDCLCGLLDQGNLLIKSRFEKERFEYIEKHITLKQKKVLDIGGNTGYFTFSAQECGAAHVDYYEGNNIHAEFVRTATKALEKEDYITVFGEYFDFESVGSKYDVCFCLNVLHHLGDDFGNAQDVLEAKELMLKAINRLSYCADIMVFQLGFNWKGNRNKCLFDNGTKTELIDFVKQCEANWQFISVGVPVKSENQVVYEELNENNILRQDELGEFLNRPIFIMKSIRANTDL